jgi:hypothetical protein
MPDAKITANLLHVSSSQLQIFDVPGERPHSPTASNVSIAPASPSSPQSKT